MKFQKRSQSSAIVLALALSVSWVAPGRAQSATSQAHPDNTRVNKRDKNPDEATADQQKMNAAGFGLSQQCGAEVLRRYLTLANELNGPAVEKQIVDAIVGYAEQIVLGSKRGGR